MQEKTYRTFSKLRAKIQNFKQSLALTDADQAIQTSPRPIEMQARFERFPARKRRPLPGLRQQWNSVATLHSWQVVFLLSEPRRAIALLNVGNAFHDDRVSTTTYL